MLSHLHGSVTGQCLNVLDGISGFPIQEDTECTDSMEGRPLLWLEVIVNTTFPASVSICPGQVIGFDRIWMFFGLAHLLSDSFWLVVHQMRSIDAITVRSFDNLAEFFTHFDLKVNWLVIFLGFLLKDRDRVLFEIDMLG
jgi:hypothetical protein